MNKVRDIGRVRCHNVWKERKRTIDTDDATIERPASGCNTMKTMHINRTHITHAQSNSDPISGPEPLQPLGNSTMQMTHIRNSNFRVGKSHVATTCTYPDCDNYLSNTSPQWTQVIYNFVLFIVPLIELLKLISPRSNDCLEGRSAREQREFTNNHVTMW